MSIIITYFNAYTDQYHKCKRIYEIAIKCKENHSDCENAEKEYYKCRKALKDIERSEIFKSYLAKL